MSISVCNSKFAILIGISVLPCPCYFANLQSKRYYWGGVVALPIKQHTPLFSQPVWSSFLSNYYRIKIAFDNSEIRQRKVDLRSKWSNKCSIMFFSGAQLTWVWKTSYTHSENRFFGGYQTSQPDRKRGFVVTKIVNRKEFAYFPIINLVSEFRIFVARSSFGNLQFNKWDFCLKLDCRLHSVYSVRQLHHWGRATWDCGGGWMSRQLQL